MKKLLIAIILLLCSTVYAQSTEGTVSDFQNWMAISANAKVSDKWRTFAEVNPRIMDNSSRLGAAYVRPAIGYDITPNWTAWLGYVLQATNTASDNHYTLENQSYEQITYRKTFDNLNIESRNAIEHRYLPSEVGHRSRNRIRGEYILPSQTVWSLIGYDEVFVNFNDVAASNVKSGISQNRAYVGIGYRFNPRVQLETGYLHQYVWVGTDYADQSNHVWSTALNLNF